LIVFPTLWILIGRKDFKVKRTEAFIREEAIKGNRHAKALLMKRFNVRYEDIPVVMAALQGNENAIEILGI
jgi:hypothetical protein